MGLRVNQLADCKQQNTGKYSMGRRSGRQECLPHESLIAAGVVFAFEGRVLGFHGVLDRRARHDAVEL